ncbi:ribosomal-protein-serine acetyltransferase [Lentibacillus halodurans]|uniref:Ribosomal-protein-serine acetyltransferase n=1 Tax=Lentibacillus halodurans TaxID=237679 RepID=A0A1I0ZWU7_9BACI|nr:GNAT family protein [Lentibacillus halodurans]SFB30234.1 ribosomal-protein-serine acetyltransferase [Lentibacillus halodurans]
MFLFEIDHEIALKHLETHDATPLFQLTDNSRERLREWLSWVDNTKTEHDSKAFIESTMKLFADRKGLTTGILYHGELAGVAGFNHFDWQNGIGSIGYWLGSNYEGKGIMTRAVSGLIDYAFYSLELNRIEIRAAYDNKKSRAIPERLGFVREGQIRQAEWLYDHFVDHVVYGMLAYEWEERRR